MQRQLCLSIWGHKARLMLAPSTAWSHSAPSTRWMASRTAPCTQGPGRGDG